MRLGGKIASRVLNDLKKHLRPGISSKELNLMAEKMILELGGKPSFKGYRNYPAAICASINEEVVHGLPKERTVKEGDLVGLDLGVIYRGFHTDTAITCSVGKISQEAQKLLKVTEKALAQGIKMALPGNFLGDVQSAIQNTIEGAGFGVIRSLVGHGIGRDLQEYPPVPNFGKKGGVPRLEIGMTLAIEPMVSAGDWHIKTLDDGWTVVTADGSLSAHFEHTIAITEKGPEILTY